MSVAVFFQLNVSIAFASDVAHGLRKQGCKQAYSGPVRLRRRLSAGEAQGMDPQNRVMLEQAASALADAAACAGAGLAGTKTAVYVGCMYQEYMQVPKWR